MMRFLILFIIGFLPLSLKAATPGQQAFDQVKHCVMENDKTVCHAAMTASSIPYFDRFYGYKLMPCLPTDFVYASEITQGGKIIDTVTMPYGQKMHYVLKLAFTPEAGVWKFDLPESLRLGLGEKWENKLQLSEQLYSMMKQNMGDKLTCDMLNNLIKP